MSAPTRPTFMFCTVHGLVSCALDDAIDRQECEFTDMQLVPLDALVLVRDADGNWPAELVEVVARKQYLTATGDDDWEDEVEYQPEYAEMSRILARAVLDAVESWMEAK